MKTIGMAFRFVRRNWLIIIAVIVNIAIGAPLAANWKNDVCYVNNQAVPCCTDCTFFCSCGDSPAP